MPDEARVEAEQQLRRLDQMHAECAEAGVLRTYIEWLVELPWNIASDDMLDLAEARAILDEDHYGLEHVKDRILDYLGVRKLRASAAARERADPLLPRAARRRQDLARALDRARARPQVRAHVARRRARRGRDPRPPPHLRRRAAGPRDPGDEAGGHQQPGVPARRDRQARRRLARRSRRRRCSRCSTPSRTTPSAITTSASPSICRRCCSSPPPTPPIRSRRRSAIAWRPSACAGYCEEEKLEIARRHVVPRQLMAAGLDEESLKLSDAALRRIITEYTREAGLRELERQIARSRARSRGAGRGARGEQEDGAGQRRRRRKLRSISAPPMAPHLDRTSATVDEVGAATGWRGRRTAARCCRSRRSGWRARAR